MAKDIFHDVVRQALESDGWRITHDGYRLMTDLLKDALTIDLGAERLITAEKGSEKIAVEVKSFLGDSLIYDFHSALGQMLVYQVNLDEQEPDRTLFLAIPESAYERMSRQRIFEVVAERYSVNFLVYEPTQQRLTQWIRHKK
jgi:hypothetical protein